MLAARLHAPASIDKSPLILEQVTKPKARAGQIIVQVNQCGVCHTDLHLVEGEIIPEIYPIIPGHQIVGTVIEIGTTVSGWKIGQRVGIPWLHQACGTCDFCQRGEENLCQQARFTGLDVNGGYAEMVAAQAQYALPLPDELTDDQAAPLLCAGIIGYRSLHRANVHPGDRVGLFGFGASAHLAIQVARYWGCEVLVFTRSLKHRNHALELGASWVGRAEDDPPQPLDRAVIFAPVGDLALRALELVRPGGTVAINAIHMSPIPQIPYSTIYGERTLCSVANATYQDGVEFLNLAIKIPLVSTVNFYPLAEANKALKDLKESTFNGEAVLKIR